MYGNHLLLIYLIWFIIHPFYLIHQLEVAHNYHPLSLFDLFHYTNLLLFKNNLLLLFIAQRVLVFFFQRIILGFLIHPPLFNCF